MKIIVNSCFVSVIKNESGVFTEQDNSIDYWNIENEWGHDKQSSRTEEAVAKESVDLQSTRRIHVKVSIQDKCPKSRKQIIFEKPQNS